MAKAAPISGLDRQAPLLVNAALIITTRLEEMMEFEPALQDPEQVYELHQMRIAAKRLRYTMDIFKPLYEEFSAFGAEFNETIEVVKALQEHLGEIHDADVLVPQLTEQLARLLKDGFGEDRHGEPLVGVHLIDIDSCQGLLQLCQETRAMRDKRYLAAQRDWQKYQDDQVFERLRGLLGVVCAEAIKRPKKGPGASAAKPDSSRAGDTESQTTQTEETAHGKDDRTDTADVRSSSVPSLSRARSARAAEDSGGHSRTGTNSGAGAAEGGNGKPVRPARRAAGDSGRRSGDE